MDPTGGQGYNQHLLKGGGVERLNLGEAGHSGGRQLAIPAIGPGLYKGNNSQQHGPYSSDLLLHL